MRRGNVHVGVMMRRYAGWVDGDRCVQRPQRAIRSGPPHAHTRALGRAGEVEGGGEDGRMDGMVDKEKEKDEEEEKEDSKENMNNIVCVF